jgi:hypothetical protein
MIKPTSPIHPLRDVLLRSALLGTIGSGLLPALLASPAAAQVAEAAVRPVPMPGFQLPTLGGSLNYAVSASESITTGYYGRGGPTEASNISGDLAYISESRTHPFSAIYSGAVLAGNTNQPTSVVQNLGLSQVLETRLFEITATNSVSYLPTTASSGLSGVAGLGDLGVSPVTTGPITGQAALTGYAPRVSNGSTASVTRQLTGKTSLDASGSFVLQRFTDYTPASSNFSGAGLIDTNQAVGSLGATHSLDGRSSVSATFTLSKVTYGNDTINPGVNNGLTIEGVNFGYTRQLTRRFSLDATLGPQWIKTSAGGGHTGLNFATDTSAHYRGRTTGIAASYVRGANSGFGVAAGGFSDSINSTVSRTFPGAFSATATLNFTRTTSPLPSVLPNFSVHTLVAGIQATRAVSRSLSAFVSYNPQYQTTGGAANRSGAFQGLFQVVAFGVTYAPRPLSIGAPQ